MQTTLGRHLGGQLAVTFELCNNSNIAICCYACAAPVDVHLDTQIKVHVPLVLAAVATTTWLWPINCAKRRIHAH